MARKPACDRARQPAPRQEEPEDNGPQLTSVIPDELKALPVYALFTELAALPKDQLTAAFLDLTEPSTLYRETIRDLPHCFMAIDVTHSFATNEVHNPQALPLCTWWFHDRNINDNRVPAQFSSPLVYLGLGYDHTRNEPTALFATLVLATDGQGLKADLSSLTAEDIIEELGYIRTPPDSRTLAKGLAEMHTATRAATVVSASLQ